MEKFFEKKTPDFREDVKVNLLAKMEGVLEIPALIEDYYSFRDKISSYQELMKTKLD